MTRSARRTPSIERRIYFYRLTQSGTSPGEVRQFDGRRALRRIRDLRPASDLYVADGKGNDIRCWVDGIGTRSHFRLGVVRRNALPQVEQDGRLEALSIPARAGLAEQTHFVLFPRGILGAEFNFYGPRPSRVPRYFLIKAAAECQGIAMDAILRGDTEEVLARLREINLLRIRVRASEVELVEQADQSLGRSIAAARQATGAEDVELVLRPMPYSKGSLSERIRSILRRLLYSIVDSPESIRTLRIRGRDNTTGTIEEIDLLSELLVSRQEIVRLNDRSRDVESGAAYAAIEKAYSDLRDDIERGAGAR